MLGIILALAVMLVHEELSRLVLTLLPELAATLVRGVMVLAALVLGVLLWMVMLLVVLLMLILKLVVVMIHGVLPWKVSSVASKTSRAAHTRTNDIKNA